MLCKGTKFSEKFSCSILLRVCASITLFARGWLFFQWGSPIQGIFWNENWMTRPINWLLLIDWNTYAATSDPYLTGFIRLCGIFLMVTAVILWWITSQHRRGADILCISNLILVIHHFAAWNDKDFQIGMLLELMLQTSAPFLLWLQLWGLARVHLVRVAMVATAATFVGHGLYAMAYHPLPASFSVMVMNILRVSDESARIILHAAGWFDFFVVILMFLPWRGLRASALLYMVIWGCLTSLARLVGNYSPALTHHGVDPWLAEMFLRSSHWMIPLWLFMEFKQSRRID